MPQIGSLFVSLGMNTAQFNAAAHGAAQALVPIEANSRKVTFALTNLGFQINDIASGLASGQAPARIFAQQFGQIIQAFTQGGGFSTVMRGAGQAIRDFITPMRVATGVVGALAVGVGLLASRVLSSEDRIRGFNVLLKGMGDQGKATGIELEAAAKRLRDVGLSTADAATAMQAARRAGIAPGQAERITRIGQNLIPVLGENAPETFRNAVTGGVEQLGKLALQLGVVTAREVELARETVRLTGHFSQLENWVKRIEDRTKGLNKLSPFGQAMRDLSQAWSQMLDAMSKTAPIMLAVKAMKELAEIMTFVATLGKAGGVGEAGGAVAGAVSGAMIGRFLGPGGMVAGGLLGGVAGGYAGAVGPKPPAAEAPIPGIDMDRLVKAVIAVESQGNPRAVSPKGAMGLMQLMPGTAREMGVTNPFDPGQNVAGGTKYLQDLLKKYNRVDYALMAYNWGPGNLDQALKDMKEIPGGVRGYAAKVMAIADPGAAGDRVLAASQANLDREIFVAAREAATKELMAQQEIATASEEASAIAIRAGRGARGLAMVAAETEVAQRFRDNVGSPEARDAYGNRARQFLAFSQARGSRALAEGGEADRQTTEQLQLQAELFGKATHEIDLQVQLLRIRQQAEAAGLSTTDMAVKLREEEAKKLAESNQLLAQQQRLMAQVREVAGVFENAFGQAFDAIAQGTFNLRKALSSLLADLGKTLASSAFKRLLSGDSTDGSGGFLGMIAGRLFGLTGLGGPTLDSADIGVLSSAVPGAQTGARWRIGGYGAMDSQLVAFRASPGEMVDVTPPGHANYGGGAEIIRIDLNPSEGWVSGIADQRIVTRSGQIVEVAVRQSSRTVQRNFAGMSAEAQARTA